MSLISVVVPVFNEEKSVGALHAELMVALSSLKMPFEIIFVDDGSTDGTVRALKELQPLQLIEFTRNYGKSQALQAGFRTSKGDYIFTLDGDLQDDPKEFPRFLEHMQRSHADLVCGWKQNRRDSLAKRTVSKIANGLTRYFTNTMVHDMNCGFKLFRREVVKHLNLYGDMHRYIPAQVAALGFRITEIPVHHRERRFGVSKYGNFRRVFKSFFDFLTLLLLRRFTDRPMHLFGVIGSLSSFVGFIILVYLSYIRLFQGVLIGHRPLLMLGILLVVIGIQLFSMGFLSELLIRQNTGRRAYTVREQDSQVGDDT